MRRVLFALLLPIFAALLSAQDYPLGPDSQPHDGVPKGTVTKFVLPPGKYYPGTPHNCAVYVPAQYDASKATPFMIFLDGSQALGDSMRVPVVFDNLIAKHDLPPMIAIFVDPGILPAVSDADQNRYNRIYEYDSLTPRFAEFLLNELIPAVAKNYNLSKNPDDRGLSGVSTGAVGAFMAAWNRPDQFHRVLSFIGTYVSMKGADALPALVRKTEPKPIRIFMQDGTQDHIVPPEPYGSSPFGSWPINNQVMYEALEFAGYDVKFEMGTEAHNLKQGGADLPDALRWLWRGYPEPIVVHEPAAAHEAGYDTTNRVFSTIYLDKPWTEIGSKYGEITSLTSDSKGNVYFADSTAGAINRVDADGNVTKFTELPDDTAILRVGANDRLYTYLSSAGAVVTENTLTKMATGRKTLVRDLSGVEDFVVTQNGTIYFQRGAGAPAIGRIDASGKAEMLLNLDLEDLNGEVIAPGGLALSPDQSMLVVGGATSRYSWSFQIAADGSLVNGEPFYRLEVPETTMFSSQGSTGSAVEDTDGVVYFATALGVQICMQNGREMEILNPPIPGGGPLTAITFAGTGNANWIYVAQGGRLYRRPVKVTGANAWTLVKPPKPTL
jgi:sugar lactone lactonase YvrE